MLNLVHLQLRQLNPLVIMHCLVAWARSEVESPNVDLFVVLVETRRFAAVVDLGDFRELRPNHQLFRVASDRTPVHMVLTEIRLLILHFIVILELL